MGHSHSTPALPTDKHPALLSTYAYEENTFPAHQMGWSLLLYFVHHLAHCGRNEGKCLFFYRQLLWVETFAIARILAESYFWATR